MQRVFSGCKTKDVYMNLLIDLYINTNVSAHPYSSIYGHIMKTIRKNILAVVFTDHRAALDDLPHPVYPPCPDIVLNTKCLIKVINYQPIKKEVC